MELVEKVLWWLKDPRNYKNTFRFLTYDMTDQEKQLAKFLVDEIRVAGLISKEYDVEKSFVAYTKADYNTLFSVVHNEHLDTD